LDPGTLAGRAPGLGSSQALLPRFSGA